MKVRRILFFPTIAILSMCFGCALRGPPSPAPLAQSDLKPLLSLSEQPEAFGIELFHTEDGVFASNVFNVKQSRTAYLAFNSRRSSRLPIFEVQSRRGRKRNILIDTSSRKSWIDFGEKDTFNCIPLGAHLTTFVPTHVDDNAPGMLSLVPYLRINNMVITENLLYVRADRRSLWPITRDHRQNVDIVMGGGMLRAFAFVSLDFANRGIIFSAEEPYSLEDRNPIASVPIVWHEGAIHVEASLNSKQTKLMLDTGGDFDLVTPDEEIEELDILRIGDLVILKGDLERPEEHGISVREHSSIGLGILGRFTIIIDMYRQKIHFERP